MQKAKFVMSPKAGFTLAELLIALALLGIIAAFTIPKVLQSSAENERVAKLREAVATLEEAWYTARSTNSVTAGSLHSNITGRLNTVRTSTAAITDPGEIFSAPPLPVHPCFTYAQASYFVFANGVVVAGGQQSYTANEILTPGTLQNSPICIDINGPALPNRMGQDAFWGTFNPWGDFDTNVGDTTYTAGESRKAFQWGSATEDVRDWVGGNIGGPAEARVGYWLTR